MVVPAIRKTDDIPRQGKGDDLSATVCQNARQAQNAGFDFVDMGGLVALAVDAGTDGKSADRAVQVRDGLA